MSVRAAKISSGPHLGNRTVDAWHTPWIEIHEMLFVASPRPISTGQLHALPHFHFRPINPMVYSGALLHKGMGDLILKRASRLDAFSGYPCRT